MEESRKIRAALFLFIVKWSGFLCWPIIFHYSVFCITGCTLRSVEGGVVLVLGQNKPLLRQRETKCDWMGFERVMERETGAHALTAEPAALKCLFHSSCGNVDHLPPASSVCKADSPASEQKTDIKCVVLTLLSRHGSSSCSRGICWNPHWGVCIIFDWITESQYTSAWFCFAWAS